MSFYRTITHGVSFAAIITLLYSPAAQATYKSSQAVYEDGDFEKEGEEYKIQIVDWQNDLQTRGTLDAEEVPFFFAIPFTYKSGFECNPVAITAKKFAPRGYLRLSKHVVTAYYGEDAFPNGDDNLYSEYVIEAPKTMTLIKATQFCLNIKKNLAEKVLRKPVDQIDNGQDTYNVPQNYITFVTVSRAGQTVNVLRSIRLDLVQIFHFPNNGFRTDYTSKVGTTFMANKKPKPVIL